MLLRSLSGLLPLVAFVACAVSPGPVAVATSSTTTPRTRTDVTVTRDGTLPPNLTCTRYCERLSACREAIGTVNPAWPDEAVRSHCEADQDDCHRPTLEVDCCATLADCQEFARCQARSREVPSGCAPGQAARLAAQGVRPREG